jgi:hypothetical protein
MFIDEARLELAGTDRSYPRGNIYAKLEEVEGPLHCVRYNRRYFESLLDENGFRLDAFDPDREKLKGPR